MLMLIGYHTFFKAVEESLKSVSLFDGGVADKPAGKYSGGMKRRLSVAISLIGNPKVQLLVSYMLCDFVSNGSNLLTNPLSDLLKGGLHG